MSLTDRVTSIPSIKNERQEAPSTHPGLSKAKRQQLQTVRLTVSLPGDLVERIRDAVYWSPSLTLAWLIAKSLRTSLAELESLRQGPFPKRKKALRAGRPRLVGQTMNVSPRPRVISQEATRSVEQINQGIPDTRPAVE